jgi:hypothetical protein
MMGAVHGLHTPRLLLNCPGDRVPHVTVFPVFACRLHFHPSVDPTLPPRATSPGLAIPHFPRGRPPLSPPIFHIYRGKCHLGPRISRLHFGKPDVGRHIAPEALREMPLGSTQRPFPEWSPPPGGPVDGFHVFRPVLAGIACSWCRSPVWVRSGCPRLRRCHRFNAIISG